MCDYHSFFLFYVTVFLFSSQRMHSLRYKRNITYSSNSKFEIFIHI